MKLTIVVADNAVNKDEVGYGGLDLSSCNIPTNVWALQWDNDSGHIEYTGTEQNDEITELPAWATAAKALWETANDAALAAEVVVEETNDPALDAIMAQYPEVTQAYAEAVIAKVSSLEFDVKVVSGSYLYSVEIQNTMPFKPVGLACTNLAGSGTAVLLKIKQFTDECAKYGIPCFSFINTTSPQAQSEITSFLIDSCGQTEYIYNGQPFLYTEWNVEKEKQKADKDINLDRIASLDAGFTWNGNTFDADDLSRTNLAGYVAMVDANISLPANFTWRDIDNNDVVLTDETIKDFATAMNTFMNQCYVTSWERKAALDAATDIEEIRAV